jgi:hypothetical protein
MYFYKLKLTCPKIFLKKILFNLRNLFQTFAAQVYQKIVATLDVFLPYLKMAELIEAKLIYIIYNLLFMLGHLRVCRYLYSS